MSSRINKKTGPISFKAGFTMVEALVYAAGLVLVIGVIVGMLYYTYSWYGKVIGTSRADQIAATIADRLTNELRSGQSVTATTTGSINFVSMTSPGVTVAKTFSLSGGRIIYTEAGGANQYLSPRDLTVSNFSIKQITTAVSTAIRFSFTLVYPLRNATTTTTYTGLAILRNSYQ